MSNVEKIRDKISEVTGDSHALLAEWYEWWKNDAHAPVKMPNALHVRTALYLEVPEKIALPDAD